MSSITPYSRMNYPGSKIKRDETVTDLYSLEVMDMPTFTILPGPSESRLAYKMPENVPYYSDGSAWYPLLGSASIKSGLGVTMTYSGNSLTASANIISGPGVQITNVGNTMVVGANIYGGVGVNVAQSGNSLVLSGNIVGSIGVDVVQTGNSLVLSGNVVSGNGITVTNSGNSRVINLTRNIVNSVGPYQTLINNGNPSLGDYSLKNLFFATNDFAVTSDVNTVFINPWKITTTATVSVFDGPSGVLVNVGGDGIDQNQFTINNVYFTRIGQNVILNLPRILYNKVGTGANSSTQFIVVNLSALPSWVYPIGGTLTTYTGQVGTLFLNGQLGVIQNCHTKDGAAVATNNAAVIGNFGVTNFYVVLGINLLTNASGVPGPYGCDPFNISYLGTT